MAEKKYCQMISMPVGNFEVYICEKKGMFFSQVFSALGSSSLVTSIKLEVTVYNIKGSKAVVSWPGEDPPLKCWRKISSFSSFCRKSH